MRLVTLDAPPAARGQPLFVEFVNTLHWYEGLPIELIGDPAAFAAWLAEHGLPARARRNGHSNQSHPIDKLRKSC